MQNYKFVLPITVRFKIGRICAQSGPHVHEHKRLVDDATENVKPHLQLHVLRRRRIFGFTGIYYCKGLKGLKCAIICYFQRRIFNPTNLLNHLAPC